MTVITVVYARPRERPTSSTTSRTVTGPCFQTRSMTARSSGPSRSPSAARRMRRRGVVTPRSSHLAGSTEAAARKHARVPLGDALAPMRQRGVELHDMMPVARHVADPDRRLAPFDDPRERHRGELALGDGLGQPAPDRGLLRRVLAQRERVEKAKAARLGEETQCFRSPFVLGVVAAYEKTWIACEEVEVEVDRHVLPLPWA